MIRMIPVVYGRLNLILVVKKFHHVVWLPYKILYKQEKKYSY